MAQSRTSDRTSTAPEYSVIIIGAGLSGLVLAHGLKRHSIPFKIYERDSSPTSRSQGYRIRLNLIGLDAIHHILPVDVYSEIVATCAPCASKAERFDCVSGEELLGHAGGIPVNGKQTTMDPERIPVLPPGLDGDDALIRRAMTSRLNADRRSLRQSLLKGLEDDVSWSTELDTYDVSVHGVTAQFKDGTTAEGSLLVGSDGARSRVVSLHTGHSIQPTETGAIMCFGKSTLTPALLSEMHPQWREGIRFGNHPGKPSFFGDVCRFSDLRAPGDYVYWIITAFDGFKSYASDEERQRMRRDPELAKSISLRVADEYHPGLRAIVENQDEGSATMWQAQTADPEGVHAWETCSRVTVLGDAIHAMPPLGGLAGNMAMRSAALLVDALAEGSLKEGWSRETIARFEEKMRSDASKMLQLCHAALHGVFPLTAWKPLGADEGVRW
ncbi:MAG: hypothetical protein TREMPRED_005493 [Tremellales sp. Tagirdzhanova-0007]|nr:MAG: hypothetical protein TREMPRED_005493 [Tremellales sp. Tagirdzhanova-0007]